MPPSWASRYAATCFIVSAQQGRRDASAARRGPDKHRSGLRTLGWARVLLDLLLQDGSCCWQGGQARIFQNPAPSLLSFLLRCPASASCQRHWHQIGHSAHTGCTVWSVASTGIRKLVSRLVWGLERSGSEPARPGRGGAGGRDSPRGLGDVSHWGDRPCESTASVIGAPETHTHPRR